MDEEILLFDQNIKKIELFFRYGGFNIRSNKEMSASDLLKSRVIYVINFFWLNMALAGELYWFIDGVRTGKDFQDLTYIAPCISICALATIKGILLVLNEKHIHILIEKLRNMEEKDKKREYSKEKMNIMKKDREFLNIVINLINWLYVLVIITFSLSPITIMAIKYSNSAELELMLPFLVLYPFDPFQAKVWPFMYLHQVWAEFVVSLDLLSADYLFFTCCTYIRIQFQILQHNIEEVIPTQNNISWRFLDDEEFKAKFKELIRWHQDLIESVQILETIYSKSTLLNFMSSSMMICLSGFNVTMVNDVAVIVIFLCFLFMSLSQVFFLCFFSDLLSASSMKIIDAVYKTQWYMAEASVGKKMLLMQTRGQKPCKLTAFGFADVNLNSFMRVLSTAWSYFALLQTIYGN